MSKVAAIKRRTAMIEMPVGRLLALCDFHKMFLSELVNNV